MYLALGRESTPRSARFPVWYSLARNGNDPRLRDPYRRAPDGPRDGRSGETLAALRQLERNCYWLVSCDRCLKRPTVVLYLQPCTSRICRTPAPPRRRCYMTSIPQNLCVKPQHAESHISVMETRSHGSSPPRGRRKRTTGSPQASTTAKKAPDDERPAR